MMLGLGLEVAFGHWWAVLRWHPLKWHMPSKWRGRHFGMAHFACWSVEWEVR